MRNFGLFSAVIAIVAAGSWSASHAGESGKAAQAAAVSHATCSSGMATRCTPVQSTPRGTVAAAVVGAGTCSSHGARRAVAARAGGGTTSWHGAAAKVGCDGCESWMTCSSELESAGASTQVVSLKNGVMYVYIAETPAGTRAVQAAVAQHHERLELQVTAGDKARLCPGCKALRGAAASGKLMHEVLNIDGGCIMVMTSSDPAVVSRIQAEAGIASPARAKG
jgi:hypothetical protein